MEKTVDSGKAEIESFITQTALATGMDIMRAQFPLAPQLPDTKE